LRHSDFSSLSPRLLHGLRNSGFNKTGVVDLPRFGGRFKGALRPCESSALAIEGDVRLTSSSK